MDKFGKAFKDFLTTTDDVDDVTEEIEVQATSDYEEANQKDVLRTDAKMIIFEPGSYEEATSIADYLKIQKPCVVNIHKLQNEYRQRLIDFLWGAVYAIDGKIQQVGSDVFLCTPKSVPVNGQIEAAE